MNQVKFAIAALLGSWDLISDYPLPGRIIAPFRKTVSAKAILFCLPLAGALAAILVWIPACLVSMILNRVAGALFFAVAGGLLFFFKDSGSGFSLFLSYVAARLSGEAPVVALERTESRFTEILKNPVMMFTTLIFMILVLGMLFLLFYRGAGFWLAAVTGADAFVQGRLCLEPNRQTKLPFIRASRDGINYLAASGIGLAVVQLLIFPSIASLGAMVVLWVWFWRELPGAGEFESGLTSQWITMYGFWAAVLTLLCGMGLL
ncbi:MAG: hypothetical protein E7048_02105 [Lentisphaerae bacterium]|nr:hypothetical protein [Lentisphaerota bacterium]